MERSAPAIVWTLFLAHVAFAQLPFTQQGTKLEGRAAAGAPQFGTSVAISADGNTAIVGGPSDNCSGQGCAGAAWVYTRSGEVWSPQEPKLVGTGAAGGAYQGTSVAISGDGNTVALGGPGDDSNAGAVWIFTRSGGTWTQQGNKLVGAGAIGKASLGLSVAISADGNTVIAGGPDDNPDSPAVGGASWVFQRNGSSWSQQGNKLVGTDSGGQCFQGYSVALSGDGNTAIVGGPWDFATRGAAWIYTRTGGVWSQQGDKLAGSVSGGIFEGWSVAISSDGNTAIVGTPYDQAGQVGAASVYRRNGAVWSKQGDNLIGTGAVGGAYQGWSVALSADGSTAIVGGVNDNALTGAVWIYARNGSQWSQVGTKLVGTGASGAAWQGYSLAIAADGKRAIVGGPGSALGTGAAWVIAAGSPSGTAAEIDGAARCTAPAISEQPRSQEIRSGEEVTLSVTANGSATPSYQWYEGASGDTSSPVGNDESTFTTTMRNTATRFWVRMSNSCGLADSETATISVKNTAVHATAQPVLSPPPQQFVLDFGARTPFGVSAAVTKPLSPPLNPGNQFTIEFWLYLEGTSPDKTLLGLWLPQNADFVYAFYFDGSGTGVIFSQNSGTTARASTGAAAIPLRRWTHIAGTLNGQTLSLLVNGIAVSTATSPGRPTAPDSSFFQFGSGGLASFQQVRIWSRALTPAEIGANANRQVDASSPGLVAWWPMNEGDGRTLHDLAPNHLDIQMPYDYRTNPASPRWIHTFVLESGPYFGFEPYQAPALLGVAGFVDFNHDGFLDILGVQVEEGPLTAFINDGHGHFSDATASVFSGSAPSTVDHVRYAVDADFNGDGLMDCFIAGSDEGAHPSTGGQARILMQQPGGRLADETSSRIPVQPTFAHSVTTGDIDANGSVDIFMGNIRNVVAPGPVFYVNDGTGHFAQDSTRIPVKIPNGLYPITSCLLVDVNKDGHPDVVLGRFGVLQPHDGLLINDGSGHFKLAPDAAMPLRCGGPDWATVDIATADFDGDGWPDLILAAYGNAYTQTCLQLLLNNGNGTFRDASDRLPPQNWTLGVGDGSYLHEVAAVDLNGDGRMDFIAHGNGQAESRLYLNKGGGYFVDATDLLPMKSGQFFSFVAGDVDNDGRKDLLAAAATPDDKGGIYLLRQLKSFDPALLFATPRHRAAKH